jgi:hypothetical protein
MYNVQDYTVLYNNNIRPVKCEGWHFKFGKHLHDRIISLIVDVWTHKTSFTPPLFIEMPVPIWESVQSCICVLGLSNLHLSTILIFGSVVSSVFLELFRQCSIFCFFRIVQTV